MIDQKYLIKISKVKGLRTKHWKFDNERTYCSKNNLLIYLIWHWHKIIKYLLIYIAAVMCCINILHCFLWTLIALTKNQVSKMCLTICYAAWAESNVLIDPTKKNCQLTTATSSTLLSISGRLVTVSMARISCSQISFQSQSAVDKQKGSDWLLDSSSFTYVGCRPPDVNNGQNLLTHDHISPPAFGYWTAL